MRVVVFFEKAVFFFCVIECFEGVEACLIQAASLIPDFSMA